VLNTNQESIYDVCIVGAGPAGATCAYYLAQKGRRVLLLDKEKFPRDKYCGDAICTGAQAHLRRMGVLQEIESEKKGNWAAVGGFVSPSGYRFIGNSSSEFGSSPVIAIKRIILDEKVARAAAKAGAELVEETPVAGATFSRESKAWNIRCRNQHGKVYQARVLVAADGAVSRLARSLGLVTTHPDAVCSRAHIKAATSDFSSDGVVFYPRELLPGYCSIFRLSPEHLAFCCYIIPGGPCETADLAAMHNRILKDDPNVRRMLGPRAEIEPLKGAPLRLGGIAQSCTDHFLVIGDAAGQIDPLTGEGIQYAMDAAEMAAQVVDAALAANDLSRGFLQQYHDDWVRKFGRDFRWSRKMSLLAMKYPILLDACAELTRKRGAAFLAEWARVMTGMEPKTYFLKPRIALPMAAEILRLLVGKSGSLPPQANPAAMT
jgi:geranylgeranyl reductase family protein